MGIAKIVDINLDHWHQPSHLLHLQPPLTRFNPEDGSPISHEYVIAHVKGSESHFAGTGIDLFPTNEHAEFVNPTMATIGGTTEETPLAQYLETLGYQLKGQFS
ncbi:hypothetical protein [Mycobacteroides chelonae]|uniref:hypothetical protein n=1 Tax=Mycobacteroides chelonae TaxID=1774 RepID=UPI0008A91AF2|nr:hypothetical protein [Mycobacteroides chelonae]OHU48098.1 hypothetical protein BKG81_11180 [Mycobacteroides chelonae]